MTPRGTKMLRRVAAGLMLLSLPAVVQGCNSPTSPAKPAGGGTRMVMDYDSYVANVAPVLHAKGCDAEGDCHGGGIRGSLELSPASAKNLSFDFEQIVLQVRPAPRDSSPLLTEPLAIDAGGTPHGFKPFASTSDPAWQALRQWVRAGVQR